MKVRVLGAHNCESRDTHYMTLLVDGVIALDAGGLTSTLTFAEQMALKAVLLTHHHYDHLRDIPALAMNRFLRRQPIDLYSHQAVFDTLDAHFLNGSVYSEFQKQKPDGGPVLRYHLVQPGREVQVENCRVTAWPMNHSQPAVGYLVAAQDGASLFYTGDSGVGLEEVWRQIDPGILFIEVTAPNRWEQSMLDHKHLTPSLLQRELEVFLKTRGHIPPVVAVHMNPESETEIAGELKRVAQSLGADIRPASEGQEIEI